MHPDGDVLPLLLSLADKSLLQQAPGPRFRMLETLREYGLDRLAERGTLPAVRAAHAGWFAGLVDAAEPHLRSAGQVAWLDRLDAERDNLVAALRVLAETDTAAAAGMAAHLGWYPVLRGTHAEAAGWMRIVLEARDTAVEPGPLDPADPTPVLQAVVLFAASARDFSSDGTDPGPTADRAEVRALLATLGEVDGTRYPLATVLGPALAAFANQMDGFDDAMVPGVDHPDPWVAAVVGLIRLFVAENLGDVAAVRRDLPGLRATFERIGERWALGSAYQLSAGLALLDGEADAAAGFLERALVLTRELGSHDDEVFLLMRLADAWQRAGRAADAEAALREARGRAGGGMQAVFVAALDAQAVLRSGDVPGARAALTEARRRVAAVRPSNPMVHHLRAISGATSAAVSIAERQLDTARAELEVAYAEAVAAADRPVLAAVGTVVADYAATTGDAVAAAEVLGAADVLRGAPDPGAREIAALQARLADVLGEPEFAAAVEAGRAAGPGGRHRPPRPGAARRTVDAGSRPAAVGPQRQRDEHGQQDRHPAERPQQVRAHRSAEDQPAHRADEVRQRVDAHEPLQPARHRRGGDEHVAAERQR